MIIFHQYFDTAMVPDHEFISFLSNSICWQKAATFTIVDKLWLEINWSGNDEWTDVFLHQRHMARPWDA